MVFSRFCKGPTHLVVVFFQVMGVLDEKKRELKAVQDNVAQLLTDFETARKKKDDLAVQAAHGFFPEFWSVS